MSAAGDKLNSKIKYEIRKDEKGRFVIMILSFSVVLVFFAALSVFVVVREKQIMFDDGSLLEISSSDDHSTLVSASDSESVTDVYPVYITGAVLSPGVYDIKLPCYLYELIDLAGGVNETADMSELNLVFVIDESMMISIPFTSDAPISSLSGYTTSLRTTSMNSFSDDDQDQGAYPININKADKSRLELLPGIGSSTADDIISYREEHGKFKKIEEIMNVPGIKESRFSKIKDKISVD